MAEVCLICNAEARERLDDQTRQITDALIERYPANLLGGVPCWNCFGRGLTLSPDELKTELQRARHARLGRIGRALTPAEMDALRQIAINQAEGNQENQENHKNQKESPSGTGNQRHD